MSGFEYRGDFFVTASLMYEVVRNDMPLQSSFIAGDYRLQCDDNIITSKLVCVSYTARLC